MGKIQVIAVTPEMRSLDAEAAAAGPRGIGTISISDIWFTDCLINSIK